MRWAGNGRVTVPSRGLASVPVTVYKTQDFIVTRSENQIVLVTKPWRIVTSDPVTRDCLNSAVRRWADRCEKRMCEIADEFQGTMDALRGEIKELLEGADAGERPATG